MKKLLLLCALLLVLPQITEAQTKDKTAKPSQGVILDRSDLQNDILLAYEETMIMNDVGYAAEQKNLALKKLRVLLDRYRQRYGVAFDCDTEYHNWKYRKYFTY